MQIARDSMSMFSRLPKRLVAGVGRGIRRAGHWLASFDPDKELPSPARFDGLDDKLDRKGFADAVADYIASINTDSKVAKERNSTVIGIYGDWGTGKTFVKRLILKRLSETEANLPVVEYNPWQWSGQGKLTEGFFQAIEDKFRQLGLSKEPDSEKYDRIALLLQKVEALSGALGPGPVDIIRYQTLTLGIIIFAFGSWAAFPIYGQYVLIGLGVIGIALSFVASFAEKMSSFYEKKKQGEDRSLSVAKSKLADILSDLDEPVLVVIDDIDRLTADQIRMMMQLVKANADFPNLVYLLLFERGIVESSLSDPDNDIEGAKFLEKIVHLKFALPEARGQVRGGEFRSRLKSELSSRTFPKALVKEIEVDEEIAHVIEHILPQFVDSMRRVNRMIPSFVFYLSRFVDEEEDVTNARAESVLTERLRDLEIYPADLLVLELLREFESAVYERIYGYKSVLTAGPSITEGESGSQEETLQALMPKVEDVQVKDNLQHRTSRVREALEYLFPALQGEEPSDNPFERPLRESFAPSSVGFEENRRVCHPEIFERYFSKSLTDSDLRKAQVGYIIDQAGDSKYVRAALDAFAEENKRRPALSSLFTRVKEVSVDDIGGFLGGIFGSCTEVKTRPTKDSRISEMRAANDLVKAILFRRIADKEKRAQVLKQALNHESSGYLAVATVNTVVHRNRRRQANDRDFVLASEDAAQVVSMVCVALSDMAEEENLLAHCHARFLVSMWYQLCESGVAKQWLRKRLQRSPRSVVALVKALSSHDESEGYHLKAELIVQLEVYHEAKNAMAQLSTQDLDKEEEALLAALQKAISHTQDMGMVPPALGEEDSDEGRKTDPIDSDMG